MLVVVAAALVFGLLLGAGIVLPIRRERARRAGAWVRWAAEHGWHHVATPPAVLEPSAWRRPSARHRGGVVALDLTRAAGPHVVRAVEIHRWVRVQNSEYGPGHERVETAVVEVDELPLAAPTLVLHPRGWPPVHWVGLLGELPDLDAGPLAATFTAHGRDAASARALLTPALARLAAGPKPPGTVVLDGGSALMVWDGPLTAATLERAAGFLLALVAGLPRGAPAGRGPGRAGIERVLADTADHTADHVPGA
ncbi:hypothetical protein GCM10023200_57750 [Actinomycetospora chlora]|uniref:Secreted protein n=1 Tax=Actinomycetospora chlora TaxID=663608 RepID=A0ABP9CJA6_9PSEU